MRDPGSGVRDAGCGIRDAPASAGVGIGAGYGEATPKPLRGGGGGSDWQLAIRGWRIGDERFPDFKIGDSRLVIGDFRSCTRKTGVGRSPPPFE